MLVGAIVETQICGSPTRARTCRVGMWRSGVRWEIAVAGLFGCRCPTSRAMPPFPHPAHRTRRAQLRHRALGGIDAELLAHERIERNLLVVHDPGGESLRLGPVQAFRLVDQRELLLFGLGRLLDLLPFLGDLAERQLARIRD